ncbi:MAG: sugar ABC transporter substrate-binding protein [Synergistaceae bacterium]|jgi:ABC-type sugar transport system substrate-binding protein|nr:sugar ABC transporter substrate-binding protein [Synergistaceae bacterium]
MRKFVLAVLCLSLIVGAFGILPAPAGAADDYYAVSLGWYANTSGQRQKTGFEESFKKFGITNFEIATSDYDPVKQSDQIRAFISKKPAALFITPSDPSGIAEAVKEACARGIKVYMSDGYVAGAEVVTTVMFDNYACGVATMTYLADELLKRYGDQEEIKIGAVWLAENVSWHQRDLGMLDVLALEKYKKIKLVAEFTNDPTGTVTISQGVQTILNQDPNKELRGIWCAWDGAAEAGLVASKGINEKILFVGTDGGEDCWNYMRQYPSQFIATAGENIYTMPRTLVEYSQKDTKSVPYLNMVPGYLVTSEMIRELDSIADYKVGDITVKEALADYDVPGNIDKLNQALEANGCKTRWIPSI